MSGELVFLLVTVVIVAIAAAVIQLHKYRYRIKRAVLYRLDRVLKAVLPRSAGSKKRIAEGLSLDLSTEEASRVELRNIQGRVEDRKQVARESDVSYHLWGLYAGHFRTADSQPSDLFLEYGEWYDVKVLNVSTQNGRNEFEFELNGQRYKFVDDEEARGWSDNTKFFSLFLYDGAGHCLIEVPMKVRIHRNGRTYSISSNGPRAFLPGDWVDEFIRVKLIHQSKRNREIRAQKHQDRLSEIADLKDRFGIDD